MIYRFVHSTSIAQHPTSNVLHKTRADKSHKKNPASSEVVDLNHIFLFLAVVSLLLVLARAWRPGGPYHGWRVAALVVLAITGIGWILFRGAAGYIGGGAWFALLFLPAIGLRKMTEFAAQGDYRSARKLGVALQILHPSSELCGQVHAFRHLESHQNDREFFARPPVEHEIARQDRRRHFRHAHARSEERRVG